MARIREFQEAKKSRHNARSLRISRYKSSKNPHVFVVQNGEESDVYEAYSPENVEKNLPLGTYLFAMPFFAARLFNTNFLVRFCFDFDTLVHTILQCLTSTLLSYKHITIILWKKCTLQKQFLSQAKCSLRGGHFACK